MGVKHLNIGIVMDPLASIHPENDTTVQMLIAAQKRNHTIAYIAQDSTYTKNNNVFAVAQTLQVTEKQPWYNITHTETVPLTHFDVILMRKDPPFNLSYIYTTYLLELAEQAGVLVLNKPQSLRDANEKLFAMQFPQCCPPTLVSQQKEVLYSFWEHEKHVVFKPLDGMAGKSIFVAHEHEQNTRVIIETLTQNGQMPIMAQRYLPEIHTTGDKRILLLNGEPVPFALARFPAKGETRGNLAVGGKGVVVPLTDRDRWLCQQIAPVLKAKKLLFVGLDVIGDYVTEINVTSPTGLAQIARETSIDIAGQWIDIIAAYF